MEFIKSVIWEGLYPTLTSMYPDLTDTSKALISGGCLIASMLIAYLIGSINFAIVLSRGKGDDIREHGSKNAGTTNMLRTYGKKAAVLTLIGDFLKGYVAAIIGYAIFGTEGMYLASLFAVLGHVFPVYYKFKGGKGIATAAGTILACCPIVLAILVAMFALIVLASRFVSLASITVAFFYPLLLNGYYTVLYGESYAPGIHIVFIIILSAVVLFKHYPNMVRLLNKTESKVSFKKKAAEVSADDESEPKKKSLHNDD